MSLVSLRKLRWEQIRLPNLRANSHSKAGRIIHHLSLLVVLWVETFCQDSIIHLPESLQLIINLQLEVQVHQTQTTPTSSHSVALAYLWVDLQSQELTIQEEDQLQKPEHNLRLVQAQQVQLQLLQLLLNNDQEI